MPLFLLLSLCTENMLGFSPHKVIAFSFCPVIATADLLGRYGKLWEVTGNVQEPNGQAHRWLFLSPGSASQSPPDWGSHPVRSFCLWCICISTLMLLISFQARLQLRPMSGDVRHSRLLNSTLQLQGCTCTWVGFLFTQIQYNTLNVFFLMIVFSLTSL